MFANKKDDSDRVNYSTTVKKSFKTGENQFKETHSFLHEELPLVAAAITAAFHAIQDLKDGVTE